MIVKAVHPVVNHGSCIISVVNTEKNSGKITAVKDQLGPTKKYIFSCKCEGQTTYLKDLYRLFHLPAEGLSWFFPKNSQFTFNPFNQIRCEIT